MSVSRPLHGIRACAELRGSLVFSPRRPRCALTITELLTVVSVITILTSMMSPVLIRLRQEALRIRCVANMGEVNKALAFVANQQNGKLPKCFDMKTDTSGNTTIYVDEDSWWYRKVARLAYPTDTISGTAYDQLTVPRSNDVFWNGDVGTLRKFNPDSSILRCPGSRDNYWDYYAPSGSPKISTSAIHSAEEQRAKDRVFDDSYGYNNYGFAYTPGYGGECNIYHTSLYDRYFGQVCLYHTTGPRRNRAIRGSYVNDPNSAYTYVGGLVDLAGPAQTLLMVDYMKADVAPTLDVTTLDGELCDGYVFRHGGKLNAMFVDGHVEAFRERMFRRAMSDGLFHWSVNRR